MIRIQRVMSWGIEMSGKNFRRHATLVEEVFTCAHAPQEYHKVC
jgi:hypothetical protein